MNVKQRGNLECNFLVLYSDSLNYTKLPSHYEISCANGHKISFWRSHNLLFKSVNTVEPLITDTLINKHLQ
jgi:hypothetical protein